jgi:hypothetical protein
MAPEGRHHPYAPGAGEGEVSEDVIERAEAAYAPGNLTNVDPPLIEVDPDLLRALVAEFKQAREDLEELLAVATFYLAAFSEDEKVSLTEAARLQKIDEIIERRGKRY